VRVFRNSAGRTERAVSTASCMDCAVLSFMQMTMKTGFSAQPEPPRRPCFPGKPPCLLPGVRPLSSTRPDPGARCKSRGGVSAREFGDGTQGLTLFPGDGYLLTFCEGRMGIAFFLNCARIEHNGITPLFYIIFKQKLLLADEVGENTIIRGLLFFCSSCIYLQG
jgi:hypothetical protein